MKKTKRFFIKYAWYILLFFIVFAGTALFIYKGSDFESSRPKPPTHPYNDAVAKDAKDLFTNADALYSYVKKYGPKDTIQYLPTLGDCHDTAHKVGRFAYELNGEKAFQMCSSECHSGCYHGATEAYFKEHGTANLEKNLKVICSAELNSFFSHQCLHGIGHGLMAWTNYDLFPALNDCNLLPEHRDSCWTGVFMENIVGGLAVEEGHNTKYLSDDPLYPCNDPKLEEQYKSSCYFLQTSRMVTLFSGDFQKVAASCSKAPLVYQRSCFESMGRDVGGWFRQDPPTAIAKCSFAPKGDMRIGCLIGAAQDTFWDPSGQDLALRFCKTLVDTAEKDACYRIIFSRAPDVFTSREDGEKFCAKVENNYRDQCMVYAR